MLLWLLNAITWLWTRQRVVFTSMYSPRKSSIEQINNIIPSVYLHYVTVVLAGYLLPCIPYFKNGQTPIQSDVNKAIQDGNIEIIIYGMGSVYLWDHIRSDQIIGTVMIMPLLQLHLYHFSSSSLFHLDKWFPTFFFICRPLFNFSITIMTPLDDLNFTHDQVFIKTGNYGIYTNWWSGIEQRWVHFTRAI